MRLVLTIILTYLIQNSIFGQSHFNYGQNKKVYFISTELCNKLDFKKVYTIDQYFENNTGGMGQNWDILVLSFDTNTVSDDWTPISLDSTFKFNFDSLTNDLQSLNGTRYDFTNRQLVSYGGGGYGTFDWKDITRFSDTISIVATSCVGHCGNQPVNYSKNVFNKQGRLLYTIFYPTPIDSADFNGETMTLKEYERFLNSSVPDTLHYKYDKKGLLLKVSKERYINNTTEVKRLFINVGDLSTSKFHQCYIGNVKMEKFIFKKLGFTPELILIEIYKYGVFSFTLNSTDKKYYRTKDIILEQ
jgi:hypothetical protein